MKDNTDLIEAYLNNELLGEDLLNFQKKMDSEPDLAKEVSLHRQIKGFVKETEVGNLKNKVKAWLQEEDAASQPASEEKEYNTNGFLPKKQNIFTFNLFAKIAAGVTIIAGLSWYFFNSNSTQNPENEYLAALTSQNPPQLQGAADDRTVWSQAYREKNYKKVIISLEKKKNKTPEEAYYLGLAYSADNQFEKAIKQFSERLITESVYSEKAEWASALIYLKLYKKIEAKQIINKIKKSESEFSSRAQMIDL